MRFTEDELLLIRDTFKNNEPLLKVLRKVFLPEYDPTAPLGQIVDLWSTVDMKNMTPEAAWLHFTARHDLIKHVESQLLQLKGLSNVIIEGREEKAKRLKKDSTQ